MLTPVEVMVALCRDHVANRHASRRWKGCPVCDDLTRVERSANARLAKPSARMLGSNA